MDLVRSSKCVSVNESMDGLVIASFAVFSFLQIPIYEGIQSISIFIPLCISFHVFLVYILNMVLFVEYTLLIAEIALLESEIMIAF